MIESEIFLLDNRWDVLLPELLVLAEHVAAADHGPDLAGAGVPHVDALVLVQGDGLLDSI